MPSSRKEPLNVRSDLVGDEDAVALGVEDDRATAAATMGLGALMVLMSIAVLVQAVRLDNGGDAIGPATMPWVVGALLLLVGVLMTVRGRRDMTVWENTDHTTTQDWKRLGVLVLALLVFAVIVPWVGYVVSATLLYAVTASMLGAPDKPRTIAYGFIVAALVFLLFDVGIGIALPAGPWGF